MNDHDLDALGRRAAAVVRAEAEAVADSRTALDRLLSATATAAAAAPPAPTTRRAHERTRRWSALTAAAAAVLIVVGVAWLVRSGSGTIDIVGPAPVTGSGGVPLSNPTTPPSSTPSDATGPASSGVPGTSTPAPSTVPGTSGVDPVVTGDPVAGLEPPPDRTAPTVGDVPMLLPAVPTAPEHTRATEFESGPQSQSLSQLWVRADASGRVDAVVQLTTRLAPASPTPGGDLVLVDGWPDARVYAGTPGAVIASLVAPSGVVDVRAYGLDEPAVLDLMSGLRPAASGWQSSELASAPWLPVDTTWSTGFAGRLLVALDASEGDIDSEIQLVRGWSMADAAPGFLDHTVSVVQVGDRTGLLFRGGVSGLIVRRDDGTVVRLGSRDPDADLVSVAATLAEVDETAWDAASELDIDVDGCVSLFC